MWFWTSRETRYIDSSIVLGRRIQIQCGVAFMEIRPNISDVWHEANKEVGKTKSLFLHPSHKNGDELPPKILAFIFVSVWYDVVFHVGHSLFLLCLSWLLLRQVLKKFWGFSKKWIASFHFPSSTRNRLTLLRTSTSASGLGQRGWREEGGKKRLLYYISKVQTQHWAFLA